MSSESFNNESYVNSMTQLKQIQELAVKVFSVTLSFITEKTSSMRAETSKLLENLTEQLKRAKNEFAELADNMTLSDNEWTLQQKKLKDEIAHLMQKIEEADKVLSLSNDELIGCDVIATIQSFREQLHSIIDLQLKLIHTQNEISNNINKLTTFTRENDQKTFSEFISGVSSLIATIRENPKETNVGHALPNSSNTNYFFNNLEQAVKKDKASNPPVFSNERG